MPTTGATLHVRGPGQTFAGDSVLEVMCCPVCGVIYAAPEALIDWSRQQPERWFYCPNGHNLHFPGKTEAQKLKEQLANEQELRASLRARLDQTEAEFRGTKAARTRFKNERDSLKRHAGDGVCPHPDCHRHFTNLERHVASKHPELLDQVRAASEAPTE